MGSISIFDCKESLLKMQKLYIRLLFSIEETKSFHIPVITPMVELKETEMIHDCLSQKIAFCGARKFLDPGSLIAIKPC